MNLSNRVERRQRQPSPCYRHTAQATITPLACARDKLIIIIIVCSRYCRCWSMVGLPGRIFGPLSNFGPRCEPGCMILHTIIIKIWVRKELSLSIILFSYLYRMKYPSLESVHMDNTAILIKFMHFVTFSLITLQ